MTAAHETTGVPDFTPGDRYRRARLNAGQRNVQEFAELLGVGRNMISSVEGDKHAPRAIVTKMWALATGANAHWLETGHAPSPDGDGACELCAIRDSNPEPAGLEFATVATHETTVTDLGAAA